MNSRNIPAVDEARKLGDRFVRDFENMSYEQLLEFYEKLDPTVDGWTTLHREKLPSGTLVGVHALICHWGLVRRRISVEVNSNSSFIRAHTGLVFSFDSCPIIQERCCFYFQTVARSPLIQNVGGFISTILLSATRVKF